MWVFCCGLQRAGSTVQYQIAHYLVESREMGKGLGYCQAVKFPDLKTQWEGETMRVIKVHEAMPALLAELNSGNAIGFCARRDLRAAVVSYSKMMSLPLVGGEGWIDHFAERQMANWRAWTAYPGVYRTMFARILSDLPGEIARMAAHLGVEIAPDEISALAEAYSLNRNRERGHEGTEILFKRHVQDVGMDGWRGVLPPAIEAKLTALEQEMKP